MPEEVSTGHHINGTSSRQKGEDIEEGSGSGWRGSQVQILPWTSLTPCSYTAKDECM